MARVFFWELLSVRRTAGGSSPTSLRTSPAGKAGRPGNNVFLAGSGIPTIARAKPWRLSDPAMKEVHFSAGSHIDDAAKILVAAATEHGQATGKFNDIALTADRSSTPESIAAFYTSECERRADAYRKSPAGIAAAAASKKDRSERQAEHDALIKRLSSLDWSSDAEVLAWMVAMQEPSDRIGVVVDRKTIVSAFEQHGFVAGANCGADYKRGDRDNEFRWLIGQALSGLKDGPAIHGIIHKFAADWRRRFGLGE